MSPVAAPRHRAPARFRIYVSLATRNLIFVKDTWTDDVVAGPFKNLDQANSWISNA